MHEYGYGFGQEEGGDGEGFMGCKAAMYSL